MIHPLRRRHRRMIFALSVIVPILFMASLFARQAPPEPNEEIPLSFDPPAADFSLESEHTFVAEPAITYKVLRDQGSNTLALELSSTKPLRWPEVLVYWVSESNVDALPESRVLLGTWAATSARTYALPPDAGGSAGGVLLYSLSQQDVLASGMLN